MRKVKTFVHVFINSLFPLAWYYKKILKTRFSFSLKYLITLIVILHILFGAIFFIKYSVINQSLPQLNKNLFDMLSNYPSDLIIRIKNSQLTTNYDHPYIMWFNSKKFPTPVLAIDSFAQPEKINEYRSYVLIHDNAITIRNPNNGRIKSYPLPSQNEYIINKNRVNQMQNVLLDTFAIRFTSIIIAGYIGILILLLIVFIIVKLLYLLLFSVIIFFIMRTILKNTDIHYKKIVQISFHASTLPLIFEYLVITSKIGFSFEKGGFIIAGIYEAYHKEKRHPHHHG